VFSDGVAAAAAAAAAAAVCVWFMCLGVSEGLVEGRTVHTTNRVRVALTIEPASMRAPFPQSARPEAGHGLFTPLPGRMPPVAAVSHPDAASYPRRQPTQPTQRLHGRRRARNPTKMGPQSTCFEASAPDPWPRWRVGTPDWPGEGVAGFWLR
jgi:hypothetical protein